MPNLDLSIVVVDDAKFSSTIIAKTLAKAGYRDLRTANDGHAAVKLLEQRQASIVIADWLMPGMDGLELSQKIRQLDEQSNHFTYIILLTAKETPEALQNAFEKGVDDFVFKSEMSKQLLPRVYAADRMADQQNALLMANQLLLDNNRHLEQNSTLDPDTGVGNKRYAQDSLARLLKHTESRGQVSCYIRIDLMDWDSIKKNSSYVFKQELAASITRRLRGLIRPLDILCRVGEDQFAIVAQFKQLDHCTNSVYRRLLDGINLTSFRTSTGFHSVKAGLSVCCVDEKVKTPSVEEVLAKSEELISQARDTSTIAIYHWQ